MQYNFIIEYLPGKINELADALSRTPNVCAISLLSGEDAVVKEQSCKGIIDGVDAAKWAEEQQAAEGRFLPSRLGPGQEKEQVGGGAGPSGALRDRQECALSRSRSWERSEIHRRRCACDDAIQNSQSGSCFGVCRTQRSADHIIAAEGAVLLARHGNGH